MDRFRRRCVSGDPDALAEAFAVRCLVYCGPQDGSASYPPLMEHPAGIAPSEPHDAADLDSRTNHYLVEVISQTSTGGQEIITAASMRVMPDAHQAREFWPDIPNFPEASRVAVHPRFSADPLVLYALFGLASMHSLSIGIRDWVATMRYQMVIGLLRRGIPVKLLNDGLPVAYDPGKDRPISGERLYICHVPICDVPLAVWNDAHKRELVPGTQVTRYEAMYPELLAEGFRPLLHDLIYRDALSRHINDTLGQLIMSRRAQVRRTIAERA